MNQSVRLTQYSHGSGCGCKISPAKLDQILHSALPQPEDARLLVGHSSRDDAAAYDLGDGRVLISTTDFFMPIVDDPHTFGRIAATNAISDVYAMGGSPLMAIAIFGWPLDKLALEVASEVIEGGRRACHEAGILLAGGHSIDAPEPIFGLAVNGIVDRAKLKQNSCAQVGDRLYLTKPLGIGILTTAEKRGALQPQDGQLAVETMCQLNRVGTALATLQSLHAMTDVTGFGLLGHLSEVCQGSGVAARVSYSAVPKLPRVEYYLAQGCSPGGAGRNFDSYGHLIAPLTELQRQLLCDPQTSGGLLLALGEGEAVQFAAICEQYQLILEPIGELISQRPNSPLIEVVE
ncbi:selenide, water dikinase SelD [Ectothiorhodospiraceae bacterium BW-2]|nr:selenide, water dikinase SelD [Ectothiorhodospiraceae bacterium BW-2]